MLTLVRNVSIVSTKFRKEFGDVFWERTNLFPNFYGPCILQLFTAFVKERPAVLNGIRQLGVGVDLHEMTAGNDERNLDKGVEDAFLEF